MSSLAELTRSAIKRLRRIETDGGGGGLGLGIELGLGRTGRWWRSLPFDDVV